MLRGIDFSDEIVDRCYIVIGFIVGENFNKVYFVVDLYGVDCYSIICSDIRILRKCS